MSGCKIFDGPQLSENWLQLTFFDGLALPCTVKVVCSQKKSLKFITNCLKTPSKLERDSLIASNLGNLSYGFVSQWNHISFSLKISIWISHWLPQNWETYHMDLFHSEIIFLSHWELAFESFLQSSVRNPQNQEQWEGHKRKQAWPRWKCTFLCLERILLIFLVILVMHYKWKWVKTST